MFHNLQSWSCLLAYFFYKFQFWELGQKFYFLPRVLPSVYQVLGLHVLSSVFVSLLLNAINMWWHFVSLYPKYRSCWLFSCCSFSTLQDATWPFLSCLFQNAQKMEIALPSNFRIQSCLLCSLDRNSQHLLLQMPGWDGVLLHCSVSQGTSVSFHLSYGTHNLVVTFFLQCPLFSLLC